MVGRLPIMGPRRGPGHASHQPGEIQFGKANMVLEIQRE